MNPEFTFSILGDDLNKSISKHKSFSAWDFDGLKSMTKGQKDGVYLEDAISQKRNDMCESDYSDEEIFNASEKKVGDTESLADFPVNENDNGSETDSSTEVNDKVMDKKKADFFESSLEENDVKSKVLEFAEMNLSRPLIKALNDIGFIRPTGIQNEAIPIGLQGKDICGAASTGSGKTAAFLIPIIQRLLYRPKHIAATRVLILTPTRELAAQCYSVAIKLAKYTDLTFTLCVGGISSQKQESQLRKNPDVVIATPGRLIDHIHNTASFGLDSIEILVLDEADRMLDDGFHEELTEIIKSCPKSRQSLLFSATMTDNVDKLISLSLSRPVKLFMDSTMSVAKKLVQEFVRIRTNNIESSEVESKQKGQELAVLKQRQAILLSLCKRVYKTKVLIFFPSKALCHRFRIIFGLLGMKIAELHGSLSQLQRIESLEKFRDGKVDYLLCTDLAARGLDIAGVETVINFQMPQSYERYVHRVGRTARYKQGGRAVSLVGERERKMLKKALKNLKPGQVAKQRVIPYEKISKFREKISKLDDKVNQILAGEKQEKVIQQSEMEIKKAENLVKHADQIYSRPARKWFMPSQSKKRKVSR